MVYSKYRKSIHGNRSDTELLMIVNYCPRWWHSTTTRIIVITLSWCVCVCVHVCVWVCMLAR